MKRHLIAAIAALAGATSAQAYDLSVKQLSNAGASQEEFRMISEDLAASLAYKPVEPAEGLGILGFDLGVSVSGTELNSASSLRKAAGDHSVPGTLPTASVRVSKGLPFDINIGGSYSVIPATSANALTLGGSWAFISGGALTPAVAARVNYTKVGGINGLDMQSAGADISISKGFVMFTPFIGAGIIKTKSKADGYYTQEDITQNRVFAGVNVNLLVMDLAASVDRTGKDQSVTVKLGFRF
jgi:hypothetical protein